MEVNDFVTSPVKWYRSLVPKKIDSPGRSIDLLSRVTDKELDTGILVCAITCVDTHLFALFPSYVSLARFTLTVPEERRCFFEIIRGEANQKPHFDIEIEQDKVGKDVDIAKMANDLIDNFIEVLIPTFEDTYQVKLDPETDIMIFTSHGQHKKSFHVIIDNYCHPSNSEAKALYDLVIAKINPDYVPFIDHAVYSKKQQFRLVGSQKRGSGRVKKLLERWVYQGKQIEYKLREKPNNQGHLLILLFEASIISYTKNCRYLKSILPPIIEESKKWERNREEGDIHPETAQAALRLVASKIGITTDDPRFPYEIRDITENLILLKRIKPSYCFKCIDQTTGQPRLHEKENPFLAIVTNEETNARYVYLDCRRGSRINIGLLPEEKDSNTLLPDSPIKKEVRDIVEQLQLASGISISIFNKNRKKITITKG